MTTITINLPNGTETTREYRSGLTKAFAKAKAEFPDWSSMVLVVTNLPFPKGADASEAMRLARRQIKDALLAEGIKLGRVSAAEVTQAARELLAGPDGPAIWAQARTNLTGAL